jgi:hypothetical protein
MRFLSFISNSDHCAALLYGFWLQAKLENDNNILSLGVLSLDTAVPMPSRHYWFRQDNYYL